MLSWLLGPHVRHLENEIAWLRQQMLAERLRAERAYDQLLMFKLPGAVPITPTPGEVRDANTVAPEETTTETVKRLLQDAEFQSVGSV